MSARNPFREELGRIPRPAYVVAGLAFAGVLSAFLVFFSRSPEAFPARSIAVAAGFGTLAGTMMALFVLLVGYVNADAKRRGMRPWLWTLLVIFVPNALGFILYFLLRRPVPSRCPECGAALEAEALYCAYCGHRLGRSCPNCRRAVRFTDAFCSNCGHRLEHERNEGLGPRNP